VSTYRRKEGQENKNRKKDNFDVRGSVPPGKNENQSKKDRFQTCQKKKIAQKTNLAPTEYGGQTYDWEPYKDMRGREKKGL